MRSIMIAAAAAFLFAFKLTPVSAAPYDPTQSQGWQQQGSVAELRKARKVKRASRSRPSYQASRTVESAPRRSGVGPRPRRWCGWWMRTQKGGGPEYNLAWNWRKYGSAVSGPQVGAVVVWRHHVGMIVGQTATGKWIVKSGNDGGAVRTRARSVSGAIFRI
jgi:hypothetical protein